MNMYFFIKEFTYIQVQWCLFLYRWVQVTWFSHWSCVNIWCQYWKSQGPENFSCSFPITKYHFVPKRRFPTRKIVFWGVTWKWKCILECVRTLGVEFTAVRTPCICGWGGVGGTKKYVCLYALGFQSGENALLTFLSNRSHSLTGLILLVYSQSYYLGNSGILTCIKVRKILQLDACRHTINAMQGTK